VIVAPEEFCGDIISNTFAVRAAKDSPAISLPIFGDKVSAQEKTPEKSRGLMRRGRDSNPRMTDLQSVALATWLPRR
jgi:hypothetical protein